VEGAASLLHNKGSFAPAAKQAAEKVDSAKIFVGQALLPVRVLPHLPKMDSQEWLSYWTFSASCKGA
jgi:hypothetical protein